MQLELIIVFIAVIANIFLGLFVYLKNPTKPVNIFFALMAFSTALWNMADILIIFLRDSSTALFCIKVSYIGAIFLPAFSIHFVVSIVRYVINKNWKRVLTITYGGTVLLLCFIFTPFIIQGVTSNPFKEIPGPFYSFFIIFFVGCFLYVLYILLIGFKKSTGLNKMQISYVFLAYLIGLVAVIVYFLGFSWINFPSLTYLIEIGYTLAITYAILKYRLMNIKIAFTRAGIFLAVYTVVLGIPFVVLSRTGSGLLATSLAVVFATAGPIIYRFLQKKAEDIVLAKQRNYQRILLQAATTMVTEHDLLKLSRLIVYILKRTINLNFTAIFVRDRKNKAYPLRAMRGVTDVEARNIVLSEEHPLISYLKENHEPFFSEEIPFHIKDSLKLPLEVRIVIPAFAGDELLAFVLLGDKVSAEPYTQEDIDVFKILSRQAALSIENCIFFEESKDAQQRMFSAEKLASIGGMADGVAHQIKNRLNQFSLASGELKLEIEDFIAKHDKFINDAPELNKTFAYLKKIAISLIDNVKRTDGIIKGILDFAKVEKKENFFAFFSLKEVADLSSNLLIIKHEAAALPLTVKIDNEDAIYGIKSQLTEVVYNLLDNAYEATKEKKMLLKDKESQDFTPSIELRLTHTQDRQVIKISDNGIGIKEEDKHKIFAPFFTTKSSYKSGSGIGVYVVKRIVEENHKGKIWFVSTYMKGTDFFIALPKNQ